MARFTLFDSRFSSSSSSSSKSIGDSCPHSPPISLAAAPADQRISSNPTINGPESSSNVNLGQTVTTNVSHLSMRSSHSDTNLMERFRKGTFVASFIGARKSFTLQKKKFKKDKQQTAIETGEQSMRFARTLRKDVSLATDRDVQLSSSRQVADLPEPATGNSLSEAVESGARVSVCGLPANSTNDYLLHSSSILYGETNVPQSKLFQRNDFTESSSTALVHSSQTGKCTTKERKCTSLRSHAKQNSSTFSPHEQSVKKSWLYPINCCLITRTDSLPDVQLDAIENNTTAVQSTCRSEVIGDGRQQLPATMANMDGVPAGQLDEDHISAQMADERLLISSLNELFLGASRSTSPNQMISADNQAHNERERAIYFEETVSEAELFRPSLSFSPAPPAEDELQELRRILDNHQAAPMASFVQPESDRLLPSSNYPLQLNRMLHSLPVVSVEAEGAEIRSDSDNGPAQADQANEQWYHSGPNQHSISNSNLASSVLPYPPPALYRSQRQSRTQHSNPIHTQIDYINCLVPDLKAISKCSFYWGKMDRYEAERLLEGKPEGTFLLRDSAQFPDHLFSVSFRRFDRSLHARIEQWKHRFSFDSHDPGVYSSATVTGLIEHYKDPSHCMFFEPMLTKPLNRSFVFGLQHLARATICDLLTYDAINELPLPIVLKSQLKEYHYRQKVRTRNFEPGFTYLQNCYYQ